MLWCYATKKGEFSEPINCLKILCFLKNRHPRRAQFQLVFMKHRNKIILICLTITNTNHLMHACFSFDLGYVKKLYQHFEFRK